MRTERGATLALSEARRLLGFGRLVGHRGLSIDDRVKRRQALYAAKLSLGECRLVLRAFAVTTVAKLANEARVLLHRCIGVTGKGERRGEAPVRGEIARVQDDGLSEKTNGGGTVARFGERRGAVAEHAQRSRAVLLLEVNLREAAIAALRAGELVDQVSEALLGLPQAPLLETLETFFESDLVVEVLRSHRPSLRSARAFGLALRELRRLSGALETGFLPFLGARIARQETGLAQRREVLPVHLEECARNAVRDRADLAAHAAAFDLDHGVEAACGAGDSERQQGLVGRAIASEVVVERFSVHDHGAFTRNEPDAGDGRLATPRALEVRQRFHDSDSLRIGSGFCAACGWSAPAYT